MADLAARVTPPQADVNVVCALDTGVAAEHPLIAPGLRGAWAYDAAWGADDHARVEGLAGDVFWVLEKMLDRARAEAIRRVLPTELAPLWPRD